MRIQPLADKIVVRPAERVNRSPGGIVLPDNAKEKPTRGTVLAVGPGRTLANGTRSPVSVKPEDVILFGRYAGVEVEINNEKVTILNESDILAVVG